MTDEPTMTKERPADAAKPARRRGLGRDATIAAICGAVAAAMVGAAFAAVPFYNWFCRTTGFNGTTQVARIAPTAAPLKRTVTVGFDSNVNGLPWKFEPEQREITLPIGKVVTIYYRVKNLSDHETTGQAAYNVTPLTVGSYFTKINCFCFTEQTLAPGESRDMPVVFYIDPSFASDSENDTVKNITLSYTYYPVANPTPKPVASSEPDRRKGNL